MTIPPSLLVRTVVMALAFLLTSCLSKNSLSEPSDYAADRRLEGVWYGLVEDDLVYLHAVRIDESSMRVDVVCYRYEDDPTDSPAEWSRYRVSRTEIDGVQYLNVKAIAGEAVNDKEMGDDFVLFKYEMSAEGSLTIWQMSYQLVERDIKNGKVAGTGLRITDNSTNLRKYVRHAQNLFTDKFGTFQKILPKAPRTK